ERVREDRGERRLRADAHGDDHPDVTSARELVGSRRGALAPRARAERGAAQRGGARRERAPRDRGRPRRRTSRLATGAPPLAARLASRAARSPDARDPRAAAGREARPPRGGGGDRRDRVEDPAGGSYRARDLVARSGEPAERKRDARAPRSPVPHLGP